MKNELWSDVDGVKSKLLSSTQDDQSILWVLNTGCRVHGGYRVPDTRHLILCARYWSPDTRPSKAQTCGVESKVGHQREG